MKRASEHFKGVTAIAWTENDPVVLSKAISKFVKDNADFYTFKAGVVDGKWSTLVRLKQSPICRRKKSLFPSCSL